MNSVFLIGRLTRDPELTFTGSGKAVATFDIAVNRQFNRNETDFFKIVVWGKPGESCATYLANGRQVGIQGRIQNNNYETTSGEKKRREEIIAERVEFLENKRKSNNTNSSNNGGFDNMGGFIPTEDRYLVYFSVKY